MVGQRRAPLRGTHTGTLVLAVCRTRQISQQQLVEVCCCWWLRSEAAKIQALEAQQKATEAVDGGRGAQALGKVAEAERKAERKAAEALSRRWRRWQRHEA